jgi:hypothetical protein
VLHCDCGFGDSCRNRSSIDLTVGAGD